jgi:hypothetical protein
MRARNILAVFVLYACLEMAHASVTVGTCRSVKHPYTTISAAIAAAPAGGVIDVCPGTYAEQVEISKPLTIRGVVIAGQPGATIVPPATGLSPLPTGSNFYPQVFVSNAGGPVNLINMSVNGTGAFFNIEGLELRLDDACEAGIVDDFTGVYFLDTPGTLDHMNISNQFGSSFGGDDEGPQLIPNCGNGVEFNGSEAAVVKNSVVSNVGLNGIYSNGELTADRNVVSGGYGPFGVGIEASSGTIIDNTVTGSSSYEKTVGIEGGQLVKGNVIQSAIYGVEGATKVAHNTLLNNAISLSQVTDASDNLISSSTSTYYNPACFNGGCGPSPTGPAYPTIGIDLGCMDGSRVRDNGIVGVGIGIANVEAGQTFSPTNLFANVTTTSTSCAQ